MKSLFCIILICLAVNMVFSGGQKNLLPFPVIVQSDITAGKNVDGVTISDNGKSWGLKFHTTDESFRDHWFILVNGTQLGPFVACSAPFFSTDGKSRGYLYRKTADTISVVINKSEFGPYPAGEQFKFKYTADLSGWCLITDESSANNQVKHGIILNGKPMESCIMITDPETGLITGNSFTISDDLSTYLYIYYDKPDQAYIKINGKKLGPYGTGYNVLFSKNGASWAYSCIKNYNEEYIVINGKEAGPFRGISNVVFSDDGTRWLYSYYDTTTWKYYINHTGKILGPYSYDDKILQLVFSPDAERWACIAGDFSFIVDGTIVGPYLSTFSMRSCIFSGNSSTWGTVVSTKEKSLVLLDNKPVETPFSNYDPSSLALSPDGKRWAFTLQNCGVVADNKNFGPFSDDYDLSFGAIRFSASGKTWSVKLGLSTYDHSREETLWMGRQFQNDILIVNGVAYNTYQLGVPYCFPATTRGQYERDYIATIENGNLKIYKLD